MSAVNIGIYSITCTINGRIYLGSSINLKKRWKEHQHGLENNRHFNLRLQSDWNLYGSKAFQFRVLICHNLSKYKLLKLESLFIQNYWDEQQCYNVAFNAQAHRRGCKSSDESRLKMSKAQKQRPPMTEETRKKMSMAKKGRPRSEETRIKIAEKATGRTVSSITKAKISESLRGHKTSEHTRKKISKTKRMRKGVPCST